ncbi:MAG: hypothetical protein K8T20_19115 [Planctomycetes bacterium]|nr:hypothetical protein [Planctomycetota bacterium]
MSTAEPRWPFEELLEKPGVTDDELVPWMDAIHTITRPETVLVLAPIARDEDRSGMVRTEAIRLIESFPRKSCSCE